MSLKKALRFSILLALLIAAHFFMQQRFSSNTIVYDLSNASDPSKIDEVCAKFSNATFNWEMNTPDYTLIMTTGNDHLHEHKTTLDGPWANPYGQDLILSQSVASKLLKTDIANNQTVYIFDKPYLVKQVVKEGNFAYIPYDPDLIDLNWQRTRFFYSADSFESAELVDEQLFNFIGILGFDVYHKTFNKNGVFTFYNLALLLIVYMLSEVIKLAITAFKSQKSHLEQVRQSYLPFYGLKTFCKKELRSIFRFLLQGFYVIFLAFVALRVLFNLILPRSLVPSNWFSLSCYIDIANQFIDSIFYQIHYGFTPVAQSTLFWLFIITIYLLVFDKWLFPRHKTQTTPLPKERVSV
jgi:hypothetical protein